MEETKYLSLLFSFSAERSSLTHGGGAPPSCSRSIRCCTRSRWLLRSLSRSGQIDGQYSTNSVPTIIFQPVKEQSMPSPSLHTLQSACKRAGPGRLPRADRHDIGAGYAAATAAFAATVLYAVSRVLGYAVGFADDWTVHVLFAALALPFVVPAAFLVGVAGWRLLPSYTVSIGVIAGGLGTIATYLVALVAVGILITAAAALSVTGAEPASAAAFSWGLGYLAVVLTWWITVPIGCLAGLLYVSSTKTVE